MLLGDAANDMKVVASNPVLQSPTASSEEKAKQLREARDFFNVFEDITLIDPTGSVIDSTTYSYYGTWPDKDFFKEAVAGIGRPPLPPISYRRRRGWWLCLLRRSSEW